MQILCSGKACAKPFTPEHDLDELCTQCKRLEAARAYSRERRRRVYHEEVKADPYLLKQHSRQSAESFKRMMQNPDKRARHLERRRKAYQRMRQDQARWERQLETQRRTYAERKQHKEQAS